MTPTTHRCSNNNNNNSNDSNNNTNNDNNNERRNEFFRMVFDILWYLLGCMDATGVALAHFSINMLIWVKLKRIE